MVISACLIGEDSLLIQCGSLLLARDHLIKFIISSTPSIQNWAQEHKIPCLKSIDQLKDIEISVDYLFSIVNSLILSPSVLNLATCKAINYHDSPLPKYAGLNATSWAIINDEKHHGITWHVMNERIDEGDIIYQKTFPIYPKDTALTLNLRCYEHAINAFNTILDRIEMGILTTTKQQLDKRLYFASNDFLPSFGFIDWKTMSADTIERMSRALTLGHYNNYGGTLKLLLAKDYVIVSEIRCIDTLPQKEPGSILAIDKEHLTVATIDKPIQIKKFLSKAGEVIPLMEIVKEHHLKQDCILPIFKNNQEHLYRYYEQITLNTEQYWINNIKNVGENNAFPTQNLNRNGMLTALQPSISLSKLFPNQEITHSTEYLLTTILVYLYRLNNYEPVSVSLITPESNQLAKHGCFLFSAFLPINFINSNDFSLADAFIAVKNQLKMIKKNPVFLSDIAARHPSLIGNHIDPGVVIHLNESADHYHLQKNTLLYFMINSAQNDMNILHRIDFSGKGEKYREVLANCTSHLVNILIQLMNHPHLSVRNLCFLTTAERHTILSWSQGEKRFISPQSIIKRFEQHVVATPDSVALIEGAKKISYNQLNFYAEQIKSYLKRKNVRPQTLLGIFMDRSAEVIMLILGILKAGCAYVPLDTKYPLLKVQQIIEDTCLNYLFVRKESIKKFNDLVKPKNSALQCFDVQDILAKETRITANCIEEKPTTDPIVYVMFTSGTTGQPKGIRVSQENVLNYCHWFSETTELNNESIVDFSSSIAFDLSVPCTIAPLLAGATIAIASNAQKTNPLLYLKHLKEMGVTHTELTPGYLEMLLNHPNEIKKLTNLQYLLLGADLVQANEVRQWLSLCPWQHVINEYGPTETTVSVTSYFVQAQSLVNESSVPIGRPAFNTTCYVLDKYKNLCPVGIKGELYIGGAQVAKGYLNRPNLTEEKFIPIHFTPVKEIIYKTGDVACWLPDKNLQFFGRDDHQVKIQGYRIELSSIEAVLTKIPEVDQAVVVVMTGPLKEKYLRAYLVMNRSTLSSTKIRSFLLSHLPIYMIPQEFCAIKSIPLQENEKFDFRALKKQTFSLLTPETHHSMEYHLSPIEQTIKNIWKKVFHLDDVGIKEDFFTLGGDSLIAMQLISELKTHYQMQLPLQLLFEHATIARLAKQIEVLSADKKIKAIGKLSTIIQLAEGNQTSTPLFLVHPVGGSIFWYKQLATYLSGKYTIYGIQDVSVEGVDCRFNSLEEMANYYLNEISKIYTGTTYCIGGASFGATVAFEMAHQLLNTGKHVESLYLFDGWAHYPKKIMEENTFDLLTHSESFLFLNQNRNLLTQLEEYRKNLLNTYQLKALPLNAILFKACELWPEFLPFNDQANGWKPYIQGHLKVYRVPGNHESMFFEPYVQILAEHLLKTK